MREVHNNQRTKDKTAIVIYHIPVITLNVNRLNSSKKQVPITRCLQKTHLSSKAKHRLEVNGLQMTLQ